MNFKITIVLACLVSAGVGTWIWLDSRDRPAEAAQSATLDFLKDKLKADKITRIEMTRRIRLDAPRYDASIVALIAQPFTPGPLVAACTLFPRTKTEFVLEKKGNEWTLPGNWQVRKNETDQWIGVLTSLHSRFAPIAVAKDVALAQYGLDEDPLVIEITFGKEKPVTVTLRVGEEPAESNRGARATFLRMGSEGEVLRLGPGVFTALDRKAEYFQQRRLFPFDLVAKEKDEEKVEQLDATAVEVQSGTTRFTVVKKDKDWQLQDAYRKKDKLWEPICSQDRLDPARRDAFLRAFPDLWAERFVETKSAQECGLTDTDADTILTVTRTSGAKVIKVKLLIGKVSETKTRFEMKPPTPGMPPMGPRTIKEEYRFAKIDDFEKIFEIKTDKLSDIAADIDDLRDSRLAHFKSDDVKRIELRHGDQDLVLVKVKEDDKPKAKEKWRFEKPTQGDADAKTVDELLDKISGLQAREQDIDDKISVKDAGFDKPAGRITLTMEEADKDKKDDKDAKKITRTIVLKLGNQDKGKLFVRVDDWPRVNRVNDELWKLVSRSDLAYRPRELWKYDRDAITRITIQADGSPYNLEHDEKKGWNIGAPFNVEVGGKEIETLVDDFTQLKAERFEAAKVKDLAKYGLDKPDMKITVAAKDAKPHTLEIGKKVTDGEGRYARLADSDSVFVVSDKLTASIRRDPFDFLDKTLLKLNPEDIKRVRFTGFALEPRKGLWQVVDAPVAPFNVDDIALKKTLFPLVQLRADKYAAFGDKIDWGKYGLEKPANTVTITIAGEKDKTTDHVVSIGNESPGGGRYARIDKKDAVVQLDADTAKSLQATYLDFVDHRVLKFDADAVMMIDRKMPGADLELTRREDNWLITKPGAREADILTIVDVLRRTSQLQAARIVAYPVKDAAAFGLDKPAAVVTISLEAVDGSTSKHFIKVGNAIKKDAVERFAMIDDKPMVVELSPELSRALVAAPLYFADRNLAAFSNVDKAELTTPTRKVTFARSDKGWKMTAPVEAGAEDAIIDDLIRSTQRLRADEIVAVDAKVDLKKYGLDKPYLTWRFKLGDTDQLNLIVGAAENAEPGARRYAKLGDKATVFLLNPRLTAKLQNEVRDRKVWPKSDTAAVSKLTISEGDKSFTLERKDGKWEAAGDPKAKVNFGAVTNTLNIVESLKAVRYAADAKADLKAFGLEKPAWKIEIEVAKDKRVLWLGGFEDKSKRMFATVAGSGTVFVLDEIDARILAQPRSAYVEEEKKTDDKKNLEEKNGTPKKQVLLLWQSPDGHPKDTHEYQLGQKILKTTLEKYADVEATLVNADEPWKEGPDLLAKADGVVLFISEGAKWLNADPKRLDAFKALAKRKAGLAVLHWGMGTKDEKNIAPFVDLFGGCHGGADRKYKVLDTEAHAIADKRHPIQFGLSQFKVHDEFYYKLKLPKDGWWPVLHAKIDGEDEVVAWAYSRTDGGRSFGFSGLHFHENWQMPEYRRLVTQGVMWTLDLPIPKDGIAVK